MKRIFWTTAGLLAITIFFSAGAYSQSSPIYFPYAVNDSLTITELILTNITGRDATVNLAAYREDGTSLPQTSVAVGARTQVVVSEPSGFRGWVVAEADVPGVLGHLRVSSPTRSAQDTTDSALPDTTLIFPLTAQSSAGTTEIAVVNPSPNNARVVLTIYDRDGRTVATTDAGLDGFGMLRGSIAALFGVDKNYSA